MSKRSREEPSHNHRLQQKRGEEAAASDRSSKRCRGLQVPLGTGEEEGGVNREMTKEVRRWSRWQQQLWLCGVGYEELLWGWFPFGDEDFAHGVDDKGGGRGGPGWSWDDELLLDGFDDIWQIKHITEIPPMTRAR